MNRKKFLQGFRKHVRLLKAEDIVGFELWLPNMQEGACLCPFVTCVNNRCDTKEAEYYRRYNKNSSIRKDDIACQMVQVYCEEAKE